MTSSITAALTTHNLSIGYDEKNVILKDLNLTLYHGQLVCFMGPNGIGKSTLIRTLAGLQPQLSGNIKYTSDKELPRQLSVVLTSRMTLTELTVHDLVVFGRYPYLDWTITLTDHDQEVIKEVVSQTRIQHLLDKKVDELSDGQLQLVMIARALVQGGDIILLDEPTAHLDLNNRVEIMNLLRSIAHQQNKAILVATHELDLALQTSDYIWLAGHKQNVITGMPEDLVLNGTFDEIFQFKGFDLKTGRVNHIAYRDVHVCLQGHGHELLWTRNALERNGFTIDLNAKIVVTIHQGNTLSWTFENKKFTSIENLIMALSQDS